MVAVELPQRGGREWLARATEPAVDVLAQGDGAVRGDRHLHLWQPDAAPGDAVLVPLDLGRVACELDARLDGRRRPAVDPVVEMVNGGVE